MSDRNIAPVAQWTDTTDVAVRASLAYLVLGPNDRYLVQETGPADAFFVDNGSGRLHVNTSPTGAANLVNMGSRFTVLGG